MAQPVKLSDHEMEIARQAAKVHNRSLNGQVEYWVRLGRAVERSPSFDYGKVNTALKGLTPLDNLNTEESDVFIELLSESLWEETPEQKAFFQEREAKGLGVGLDDNDNLAYAK